MNRRNKVEFSVFDIIWRALISVRLTIMLLSLIILSSVAGSLIGQKGMTQTPIEKLYTATELKWLLFFGLTDIFHSGWFVAILTTLALNLLACSIERLPGVWRQAFKVPAQVISSGMLAWDAVLARSQKFIFFEVPGVKLEKDAAKFASALFLQKYFKKYRILEEKEDSFQFVHEHGKYSRLGVYITHLSLLLIMAGAVVGAIFGFEGGMSIEEGTKQDWIQHLKGSTLGKNLYREKNVPVPGFLSLGFEVECNEFSLETYDGSRPKLFKSVLKFYENDVLVDTREVSVNNPTVFKGLTFYQASYSEVGPGSVTLKVYRVSKMGKLEPEETLRAIATDVRGGATSERHGKAPSLSNKPFPKIDSVERVEKINIGDTYRIDGEAGFRIVSVENNLMDMGPAAKVQFFKNKKTQRPEEFWIFKNLPGFDFSHRNGAGIHFVLEEVKPKFATGLSVARDPGANIVWAGSLILVAALFIALYTFQGRYWVVYDGVEKKLTLVGWSNKLFLFENKFEKFSKIFSETIGKEEKS